MGDNGSNGQRKVGAGGHPAVIGAPNRDGAGRPHAHAQPPRTCSCLNSKIRNMDPTPSTLLRILIVWISPHERTLSVNTLMRVSGVRFDGFHTFLPTGYFKFLHIFNLNGLLMVWYISSVGLLKDCSWGKIYLQFGNGRSG